MMLRSFLYLVLFICAPLHWAEGDESFGWGNLALLKETDLVTDTDKMENEQPQDEEWYIPSIFGGRFGVLYPGASRETGTFLAGPSIGAYARFDAGAGLLEVTVDISSHKSPGDVSGDYRILVSGGANYLFSFGGKWFAGGGISIANSTPMNDMLVVQITGGVTIIQKCDIALTFYHPAGSDNNTLFTGLYFGYRF